MPEWGIYYAGGWQSPISLWWIDPSKEEKLNKAKSNNTALPKETEIIDYWNRR